jgi:hypothetical protein
MTAFDPKRTFAVAQKAQLGNMLILVPDGNLPYPFGHEVTGYQVKDLDETLSKARASGATVLFKPYTVAVTRARCCNLRADISLKFTYKRYIKL